MSGRRDPIEQRWTLHLTLIRSQWSSIECSLTVKELTWTGRAETTASKAAIEASRASFMF